jgi:mannose-1-phosphate guanylyltransferase / mannose-6-phosphate isomerase
MTTIVPVILSGGAGSRLWPLSTQDRPKQFSRPLGGATMFAQTLGRVSSTKTLCFAQPRVVCGSSHVVLAREAASEAGVNALSFVLEPMARNTAPALAATALVQAQTDPDAIMLVLPADHLIASPENFHDACQTAAIAAQAGSIVTFGIVPDCPETGYGYIKQGEKVLDGVYQIETFKEKPDLATAQSYLADGSYAWNAGIFMFKCSVFLRELELHAPEVLGAAREAVKQGIQDGDALTLDSAHFSTAPSISIDFALMEKTRHGVIVPVDMGWNDIGSFATIWDVSDKDTLGNVTVGAAQTFDCSNCLVQSEAQNVAVIGLSDIMVIVTPAGILVAPRERAQDVRLAADHFKARSV